MTAFVIKGSSESLLGALDGKALGIIKISPMGDGPQEAIRKVNEEPEIRNDKALEELIKLFPNLLKGIGKAKVPPVHFTLKEGIKPVTQKLRPVPANLMSKLKENLDKFVEEGVIEGPLGPEHGTGWLNDLVREGFGIKKMLSDIKSGSPSQETKSSVYAKVFPELAIVNGVIVRGDRIVKPEYFVPRVIAAAHEGQMGIEKTIKNILVPTFK